MRIRHLYIIVMSILPLFNHAQEWVARYNGAGNGYDAANAIAIDATGNVYVTGQSVGSGPWEDQATVKYDASGFEQWVARYNGQVNGYDAAYAIAVDNAGDIYVTGQSDGSSTWEDYATVKYDSLGVEQWVARYNGPGNDYDAAYAIAVDNAGDVYITGQSDASYTCDTSEDYATVKYDALGVEQWVARFNGPGNSTDWASAIALDTAGSIYVTGGSVGSGTGYDYATVKYDASGIEQWVARYNGPGNDYDAAYAIAIDAVSNIYVTGGSYGSGGHSDYAIVKYDTSGTEQWVARYNGLGNGYDAANAIAVDNAGDIYITGGSIGSGTGYDYATVKYDSLGVEQWVVRYNGPGNGWDHANAIAVDNAGNVYVTGYSDGSGTWEDYATVKYDSLGVEQWVARYNGPGSSTDWASAIALDAAGSIYVAGGSVGSGTGADYATVKYSSTGIEENKWLAKKGNVIITTIFSGSLRLPEGKKCKVYDVTGRIVEPSKITRGIYFIEVEGEGVQKVVKIR